MLNCLIIYNPLKIELFYDPQIPFSYQNIFAKNENGYPAPRYGVTDYHNNMHIKLSYSYYIYIVVQTDKE